MKIQTEELKRIKTKGITIFGILFIVGSLYWFISEARSYSNYRNFLQPLLPEKLIYLRYIASICLRILAIITGIGILCINDFFRKTAIVIGFFNIATIFLRHPIYGFVNMFNSLKLKLAPILATFPSTELASITLNSIKIIVWTTCIFAYCATFIFSALVIYYFRLPKIRQLFNQKLNSLDKVTKKDNIFFLLLIFSILLFSFFTSRIEWLKFIPAFR